MARPFLDGKKLCEGEVIWLTKVAHHNKYV